MAEPDHDPGARTAGEAAPSGPAAGAPVPAADTLLVKGLLATLPLPGTEWPVEKRARWLSLMAGSFELIYLGEGDLDITVPEPPGAVRPGGLAKR